MPPRDSLRTLADSWCSHIFDLLGSGWLQADFGAESRGLEGYCYGGSSTRTTTGDWGWLPDRVLGSNLDAASRAWHLVEGEYSPIDWQQDFKSGYRWSDRAWSKDLPYGHLPGVDIKVPWELARMQHLSALAWAFACAREGQDGFSPPERYQREFRNQILDFIAANPPRFGVNWRCTMDVAIRAANWLVAFDLFRAHGAEFDSEFTLELKRSIYEHGLHVVGNLEWDAHLRGNHYLANVVGLMFIAAYLPGSVHTDRWLAFSLDQLVAEVAFQFNSDGSNFEASACYHRLSAEMVVYATALARAIPEERLAGLPTPRRLSLLGPPVWAKTSFTGEFPDWYVERLQRMAEFTRHLTKPDGRVAQIGDNDSGRFLKLDPKYVPTTVADARARYENLDGYSDLPDDATYWVEDALDHGHLVSAIGALFGETDPEGQSLDARVVRQLAGPRGALGAVPPDHAATVRVGAFECWPELLERLSGATVRCETHEFRIPGPDLREGLRLYAYPDFGLYINRSERLYLAVRCGPIGQRGNGGHAHNDQLGIELNVDGQDWVVDPGTYLYTPLPHRRNEYRSVRAHFAPQLNGREPGRLDLGLFALGNEARAECLYAHPGRFLGRHFGYGAPVYRSIEVLADRVLVRDHFADTSEPPTVHVYTEPLAPAVPHSPAYGVRLRQDAGQSPQRRSP